MSFPVRERLRGATHASHEALDLSFSHFDLAEPAEYGAFLTAHARALLPIEAAFGGAAPWGGWQPRGPLLEADLAALGLPLPTPIALDAPATDAARWGTLYVIEGSRLGGAVLVTRVGTGLPTAYLGQRFAPGEWRDFLAAIEAAATGEAWIEQAVAAANAAFGGFARALQTGVAPSVAVAADD